MVAVVSSGERNSSSVKRRRREDLPTDDAPMRRILSVGMSEDDILGTKALFDNAKADGAG